MAKFVGDNGSNGISGTSGSDEIYARGGDDLIDAGGGNDYIVGGAGGDGIDGGSGFDTVGYSGPASAYTFVRRADLEAQVREVDPSFSDIIYDVYGPDGKDQIQNIEAVVFNIDLSIEIIVSGDPVEDLCAVTIEENGDITLCETDDVYEADGADNVIFALGGDDIIKGKDGDDIIDPGTGEDKVNGGNGFDTVSYATVTTDMVVNLDSFVRAGAAPGTAVSANGDVDRLIAIEAAVTGSGDDKVYGSTTRDTLNGGDGDDEIYGRGGNDTLIGGAGDDFLNGASGRDIADYSSSTDGIIVNGLFNTVEDGLGGTDSLVSIARIIGTSKADTFNGAFQNDYFVGGAGNDVMTGAGGKDIMFGDGGNDILSGGELGDKLYGGRGRDTLDGGDGRDILRGEAGNDTISGGDVGDRIWGGDGNDTISGDDGYDIIYGGDGNDIIDGGLVRDILRGGDGDDTITGGEGNDRIEGGAGTDTAVYDGDMADYLITVQANGLVKVDHILIGGNDGLDILTTIEFLQFNDGTMDVSGV